MSFDKCICLTIITHQDKEQFYHLPPKSPNLQATYFLSLALPVPECYINLVINVIQMASFI